MLYYLYDAYNTMVRYADRLSPSQWVMLLVFMIVVGVFCLRGYGSRSNY